MREANADRVKAALVKRDASVYRLIDYRISRGDYKPEEREQKFAEIIAFLELHEMKFFRPNEKTH